ncbi:NADH dehydrogenase [ubiquinone] iron-sulfur protein 5-like [Amphiura filiformis]|uniref:NADH dehydrogenase [ubiquinone] iron-sulfur protein 5-like n=1 Tax=Amphiura filiformis TaxID=82378 RepID=UPI003B21CA69
MSDDQIDQLFAPRRDHPLITVKWVQEMEKKWMKHDTPSGMTSRCDPFRADWLRCADGLNFGRAKAECRLELEDFLECLQCNKQQARQKAILQQRDRLMKEGKYTAPPFPES